MTVSAFSEAKSRGEKYYHSPRPCPRGHVGLRRTSNSKCRVCEPIDATIARNKNPAVAVERTKRWRQADPERAKSLGRDAYARNKEAVCARKYAWRQANPDKVRDAEARYYENNRVDMMLKAVERRAARLRATPAWADWTEIRAVYEDAARKTEETGVPHHVDHIIPLRGKTVCGLHVSWNLQAIPAIENLKKGNCAA